MTFRELFEANLAVIERAIGAVCAHASLRGADAEDFASVVKLKLLEDDCAIVRQWEGRSSFSTYITIVIRRLLINQIRASGRYYASAAAQKHGEAAVMLERLMARDARPFGEAMEAVRAAHPDVTADQLSAIAATLPERAPRVRLVAIGEEDAERFAAPERADDQLDALDRAQRSAQASGVVRDAMRSMSAEDRLILRLRFVQGSSIADIARALAVPQRPLYRRIETLLATLRRALERSGLDAASVTDLIGGSEARLDFQLDGKTGAEVHS